MKTKSEVVEGERGREEEGDFDNARRRRLCGGGDKLRPQRPEFSNNAALFIIIILIFSFTHGGSYKVTAVIKWTYWTTAPLIMLLLSTGAVSRIYSGVTKLVLEVHVHFRRTPT